jgi:IMP dehydrogenase
VNLLEEEAIKFDDVTLVPNYSTVKSRKEPDVSVEKLKLYVPVIAAPMNTVCEKTMAKTLLSYGADAVIHRYMSIEEQLSQAMDCNLDSSTPKMPFFAIGATGDYLERAKKLYDSGVRKFCIDVASGDSESCINAVKTLKSLVPDVVVMAGNVCTASGYANLAKAGTDLIRVGVGSGAMCKTRVVTGHGVPQLTALLWAAKAQQDFPNTVMISDGGIRTSGDIVKALAIADVVMLGSLLAGTDEAPGQIIKENGEEYKLYAGMASEDGRSLNNWFDREKTSFIPEGESVRLKCKGPVINILDGLIGSLKVGMSYAGASSLRELKEKATFIRVTNNGAIEGTPHGKGK